MSLSLHTWRLLFTLFVCTSFFTIINGMNASNATTYHEYEVGFMISSNWASGSSDDVYFQLCNEDNQVAVPNSSNTTSACTGWYAITGGMDEEGHWYFFDFDTTNIGTTTEIRLVTFDNDALCIGKVAVDDVRAKNSAFFDDCIEVPSGGNDGRCDVLYIKMDTEEFEATLYDPCIYNTSGSYEGPPITTMNGTRTYEVKATVSNKDYSGTATDLFMRLCTDEDRDTCTDWYTVTDGMNTDGYTYIFSWNTNDLGNISFIDFSSLAADRLCLSAMYVDNHGFDFDDDQCIEDDSEKGCQTLMIDLYGESTTIETDKKCGYDIALNETYEEVDYYKITWEVSDLLLSGSDQRLYYIVCDIDGECSSVYEIRDGMNDEGDKYTFKMQLDDYDHFNTLSDFYSVDLWTYADETFCLSEVSVNEKELEANAGITPECIDSDKNDNEACSGMNIIMSTEEFTVYDDKVCRWNDELREGTVIVSKAENIGWLKWMENNWLYVGGGVVGLAICIVIICCIYQSAKKEKRCRR